MELDTKLVSLKNQMSWKFYKCLQGLATEYIFSTSIKEDQIKVLLYSLKKKIGIFKFVIWNV